MGIFLGIFELRVFVIERIVSPVRVWTAHVRNRILWSIYDWVHRPAYMQEGQNPQGSNNDEKKPKEPQRPNSQDGPPDLDELWNDFNRRLGGLFGGNSKNHSQNNAPSKPSSNSSENEDSSNPKKPADLGNMAQDWFKKNMNKGGSGGGSGSNKGFNFPNIGLGVLFFGVFAIWLFSGIFIVQEGQAGIVLQFGKYKYTTKPGINWRIPYPIQTHEIVNVSNVRSVEIGRSFIIQATNLKDSSMLTEDENIIDVKFAVQYRLKEPTEFIFNNRDPDGAVVQAAETSVREIVGKSKMDDVLYVGRERIGVELAGSIQKILDSYKTGIYITSVNVQNVQPPEQVQAAFDDAVKAGQDQERQKNEGQAYANDVIPRAKGAAARLMEEAEGYKAKVVATAEGDAARFKQVYAEYSKAQQVTRDRMYIDMMQQVYNSVTKVLVDTHNNSQMLYLPLDKLIQQTSSADGQTTPSSGMPASSTQPPSGSVTVPLNPSSNLGINSAQPNNAVPDKREVFRSRERELR